MNNNYKKCQTSHFDTLGRFSINVPFETREALTNSNGILKYSYWFNAVTKDVYLIKFLVSLTR